ncbi:hypothetical protein Tco_0991105 [Tanacetum coccineum]|uniref:Uncharacterized protein n=1 Tax=Tanacetum coccineum TaxID=301880 RepID=A0ABQ5EYC8_9ASTR
MVRKVACGCHGDEGGDEVVMVVRGVGDDGDGGGFGCWWAEKEWQREMTTREMVRKVACGCHGDEGGDEVVMVVRGVGDDGDGGGFGCWWGGGEGVAAG